jgi:hypothetical protein
VARKKKSNNSTPELDLHGVKHADVEVMVEDFVLLRNPPIKIITGNSKAMKDLVKKALDRHKYKYLDGEFYHGCIMVLS